MSGDGNGWSAGPGGSALWGRFGAAGLMLLARSPRAGEPAVLLQHRAPWTNHGGTWALPGGARDSHESAVDAALRETEEETGLPASWVVVREAVLTAGPYPADPARPELSGGWTYTTVLALAAGGKPLPTHPNNESLDLRWVPLSDIGTLDLLPAFARSLPDLSRRARAVWQSRGRD